MVSLQSEPESPGKRLAAFVLERAANLANIRLHRDGFAPSPDQKAEILTAIEDLETLARELDQEVSRAEALELEGAKEAKLEHAENEPNHLTTDAPRPAALKTDISVAQLAISRTFIAPILLLPPELLLEIFACLLVYPDTWHLEWMETHCPSFVCVCAHWRRVALATPSLWTTIHIEPSRHVPHVPERMNALLHRSASMPLDIELSADWAGCAETLKFVAQVSRDRWGCLSLQDSPSPGSAIWMLVSLKGLVVDCRKGHLDLSALVPVWPALTSLTLHPAIVHLTEYHNALHAIRLHWLTLERLVVVGDDGEDGLFKRIVAGTCEVPNLRSVEVQDGTHSLLKGLVTPKLENFTLHRCRILEDENGPFKGLANGTLLESRALRRLRIFAVFIGTSGMKHLHAALDALPTLQSLEVDECNTSYILDQDFLRFLTLIPGESPLLPCLTSLSLLCSKKDWKRRDPAYHGLVGELVRSRVVERTIGGVRVKKLEKVVTNLE